MAYINMFTWFMMVGGHGIVSEVYGESQYCGYLPSVDKVSCGGL